MMCRSSSWKTRWKYPNLTNECKRSRIMPCVLQNLKRYYNWETGYYWFKEKYDRVSAPYLMKK